MRNEPDRQGLPEDSGRVGVVVAELVALVRGAAFWVAALLPLSYLPLLYLVPISLGGFTQLLLLNTVALLVGHGHRNDGIDAGD